jgi:hypothetical protein
MRQTPPSIFEGPEITRFTDFSLGDIEAASGKKIFQGSSDYKWSVDYGRDGAEVRGGTREVSEGEPPAIAPEPEPIRQTPSTTDLSGGTGGGDVNPRNVEESRLGEGLGPVGTGETVTGPPRGDDGVGASRPDPSTDPAAAGRIDARKKIAERSRSNYRITDADALGQGGPKVKIRANIEAIKTLKLIEDESREATPEEKSKLVKYVGWGAFS